MYTKDVIGVKTRTKHRLSVLGAMTILLGLMWFMWWLSG